MKKTLIALFGLFAIVSVASADVILEWNGVTGVDGYRIYQREANQSYGNDPAWAGTDLTATIPYLEIGKTYFFVARAYKGSVESADSNEVSCTIAVPTVRLRIVGGDGQTMDTIPPVVTTVIK